MGRLSQGRRGTVARSASMLFIVSASVRPALGLHDTPFGSSTAADLSCAHNRGSTSSAILLSKNLLTNDYRSLVTGAPAINRYDVLSPFVARCQQQRGMLPNYLAVNFDNEGDLFRVIDELNGVP